MPNYLILSWYPEARTFQEHFVFVRLGSRRVSWEDAFILRLRKARAQTCGRAPCEEGKPTHSNKNNRKNYYGKCFYPGRNQITYSSKDESTRTIIFCWSERLCSQGAVYIVYSSAVLFRPYSDLWCFIPLLSLSNPPYRPAKMGTEERSRKRYKSKSSYRHRKSVRATTAFNGQDALPYCLSCLHYQRKWYSTDDIR